MALLIDGYNLLHVTAIVGRRSGLHGSRQGLLRFLAAAIDPRERPRTTIVFDAAEAPSGLPRSIVHEEMTVRFSSGYDDADELIEELILAHDAPRSLLVVSSDHRLQRAARRRRAAYVDSDVWFAETLRKRAASRQPTPAAAKPQNGLSAEEIDYWLSEFGDAGEIEIQPPPIRTTPKRKPSTAAKRSPTKNEATKSKPAKKKAASKRKRAEKQPPHQSGESSNPFPPGYAEDLLDGDSV